MAKQTANIEEQVAVDPMAEAPAAPESNWDALQTYNQGGVDPFDAMAAGGNALPDDYEIAVDTSDVEGRTFLPVGTYHGRCTGIKAGKPSAKGDPCWIWTLQVTEGAEAGGTIDMYTYTGATTLWKFAEVKRALGFEDKEAITPGAVRNRACTFVVVESTYQGKTRTQCDTVVSPAHAPMGSTVEYHPNDAIPF